MAKFYVYCFLSYVYFISAHVKALCLLSKTLHRLHFLVVIYFVPRWTLGFAPFTRGAIFYFLNIFSMTFCLWLSHVDKNWVDGFYVPTLNSKYTM